jgi:hypothetical protein
MGCCEKEMKTYTRVSANPSPGFPAVTFLSWLEGNASD